MGGAASRLTEVTCDHYSNQRHRPLPTVRQGLHSDAAAQRPMSAVHSRRPAATASRPDLPAATNQKGETMNVCKICGGELNELGTLGNRLHLRCRNCGADCSVENSDNEDSNLLPSDLDAEMASEMSPWDIAKLLGVHFTGDLSPFDHGGTFYDTSNWREHGYADCVSFWTDPETDETVVECGTINRTDVDAALECYGLTAEDLREDNRDCAEIESCLSHSGSETCDDMSGSLSWRFHAERTIEEQEAEIAETGSTDVKDAEVQAWEIALNHIRNLGSWRPGCRRLT